jgi:hydroxypyruvate isomerase
MKTIVSACMETLFVDSGDYPKRIIAAKNAGCSAVEMWFAEGKDSRNMAGALAAARMPLRLMLAGPVLPLGDRKNHGKYIESLPGNFRDAAAFGTDTLIVQSGNEVRGIPRKEQLDNVRDVLAQAAESARKAGMKLLFEPLNTLIDHKGYLADDSREVLALLREVDSPALGMLLDIYHASVMEEDVIQVMKGNLDLISHVHVADTLGRHEPGTGDIDYAGIFRWMHDEGYRGSIGLEYFPLADSAETVASVLDMLDHAGFSL